MVVHQGTLLPQWLEVNADAPEWGDVLWEADGRFVRINVVEDEEVEEEEVVEEEEEPPVRVADGVGESERELESEISEPVRESPRPADELAQEEEESSSAAEEKERVPYE